MELESRVPDENCSVESNYIKKVLRDTDRAELFRVNELIEQLQSGKVCQGCHIQGCD